MYFNYRLFFKAVYLALFRMPFRIRRWAYVLFFTALYLLFLGVVLIGRLLDGLFFPGFKKQPVHEPVFVIAPPRSGTTLVQKLLSLDHSRFVHLKMYQTIFPSITYQRLINLVVWIDTKLGSPAQRLLAWCEKKWFGGWDDLHKLRLDQPEEDDALFLYAFASEAIFLLYPFVDELWQAGFPDALPPEDRRKLMGYYRSCLQRHLFANGPTKTLLSKSTQSSGTVESLLQEFPDAKFITIVRHPYKSVASHVSLFVPVWQTHSPDITRDGPVAQSYGRLAVEWFKHLHNFRTAVDPKRYYCIDYRELVEDPGGEIAKLYGHFGWEISNEYREQLAAATQRQRNFESKHHYTLSEFGLSEQWIQTELKEIFLAHQLKP